MVDWDVHLHHQLAVTSLLHLAYVQACLLKVEVTSTDEHFKLMSLGLNTHLVQLEVILHILIPAYQALHC